MIAPICSKKSPHEFLSCVSAPQPHLCSGFRLSAVLPFQLGEDQRLCLSQPVGFGQLLDNGRLLFGELDAAARECREVFYGIVKRLAQLYGGRLQVTVQNGGEVEGYGLRPLEVLAAMLVKVRSWAVTLLRIASSPNRLMPCNSEA